MPRGQPLRTSQTGDPEERLLIEAAQRDSAHFADLYDIYFDRIYAYVASRVGSREETEDLVSEVFHKALANLRRFEWQGAPFSAFEAEDVELYRAEAGGPVTHAKVRLGDTILEMGEAHGSYEPMPTALHFYVPDVDAVYHRALKAGATSIGGPVDQPYGERGAGVKDPAGNSWFLATPLGSG